MILEYVKVDGTSATVKHYVTSVTNATTAAVTLHPGTVDENLAIGAVVYLNSTPIQQNSNIDTSVNFEGVMDYNYTQIFRRDFNVARTTQQVANYSIDDQIAKQEMYNLKQLEYQINRATISGERVAPTGTAIGTRGEMGGLFTFLRDGTGNKLDASGGALSPDLINDAAEIGLANGADGMAVMVCHPTQRRTISTFNDNIIRATREAAGTGIGQIAGGSVDIYETDQGLRLVIVADRAVAQDQLAIVDPSRIQYATMEGFTSEIYKVQGNDGINGTILGEITLEVRNPDDAHVLIEDLAV